MSIPDLHVHLDFAFPQSCNCMCPSSAKKKVFLNEHLEAEKWNEKVHARQGSDVVYERLTNLVKKNFDEEAVDNGHAIHQIEAMSGVKFSEGHKNSEPPKQMQMRKVADAIIQLKRELRKGQPRVIREDDR